MMTPPTNDIRVLRRWVGRAESVTDVMAVNQARLMQQTLDREASLENQEPLPPLWHFIYFLTSAPMSGLGRDGHPARGGFLPPVALPRRMWAGGRFQFHGPVRLGARVTRTSTITDVSQKTGRTGALCFVTVTHEFAVDGAVRITEEQDLVYREDPAPGAAAPAPPPAPPEYAWSRTIHPGPVLLFRYSALTFNGHRIHYDRDYCREVEGYPGLVFHGPLTATLLADLAVSADERPLRGFSFRAVSPLFDTAAFAIRGRPTRTGAELWAETPGGGLAMRAEAIYGDGS